MKSQEKNIYLDNNATTLPDPRVIEVMSRYLKEGGGNPSSIHAWGRAAKAALNQARRTIADYLKVKPAEIFFTSSGTEGANMLLRGLMNQKGHILTSSAEHACVFATVQAMEQEGFSATFLSPGLLGAVTPEAVQEAMRPDTRLISLMAVNNETGVKTDIVAIAEIAKERRISFLVDGVAWLGKEPLTIPEGVSAMFFSGHKLHCPPGIGFAYVRSTMTLKPLLIGGSEQESGKRGGTENLLGIVGLEEAVRLLHTELPAAAARMQKLRDRLEEGLLGELDGVQVNGSGPRIANTSNLSFDKIEGETLLTQLDLKGIAASHGSACASGALEPSRVLRNMGLAADVAASSIRFSLSRMTTEEEIDRCIEITVQLVRKM
ncbi:MAG: cysteine desulfurase [Parachlamydia sp.]|nr:cysteine desulfurase [Parachlamydia sp.]